MGNPSLLSPFPWFSFNDANESPDADDAEQVAAPHAIFSQMVQDCRVLDSHPQAQMEDVAGLWQKQNT